MTSRKHVTTRKDLTSRKLSTDTRLCEGDEGTKMNMAGSNKPKQKKICYTTVEVLKTNLTTLKKKDVTIIVDLQ